MNWLLTAPADRAASVIVQRWDDPDWEHVWRLYISELADNDERRQHFHDVAMISFLPETGQFSSYCSLIRLKWAGYNGSGHCDAEEEVIDWALESIRKCENEMEILRIGSVLASWERDFDEPLATALRALCADCANAEVRKTAMKALISHSSSTNSGFESQAARDLPRSGEALFLDPRPSRDPDHPDTQKIVIPRTASDPPSAEDPNGQQ